jgi:hypothetical protein
MPYVITANSSPDGSVLFLVDETTWSTQLAQARMVHDTEERDRLIAIGQASQSIVADPYAIEVIDNNGVPVAKEFRERIRASGPTVRYPGQTSEPVNPNLGAPVGAAPI